MPDRTPLTPPLLPPGEVLLGSFPGALVAVALDDSLPGRRARNAQVSFWHDQEDRPVER